MDQEPGSRGCELVVPSGTLDDNVSNIRSDTSWCTETKVQPVVTDERRR